MSAENLLQNIIVLGVLLALFILAYCRLTGKTMMDMFREIREGLNPTEE